MTIKEIFLSTPSARRATCDRLRQSTNQTDFYPRPPRGGRHNQNLPSRAEGEFLSTPSARRATGVRDKVADLAVISIHALREEGDDTGPDALLNLGEFLSTPSARRATTLRRVSAGTSRFLSTPSARRATNAGLCCEGRHFISIHALREEGDLSAIISCSASL